MKRVLALVLVLCTMALLWGCTAQTAEAPQWNLSADEASAMSTFMNGGRYLMENGVLYGEYSSDDYATCLAAITFHMEQQFPEFDSVEILVQDVSPRYLCTDGTYFFFTDDDSRLCRFHRQTGELAALYHGDCAFVQLSGDRVFFTDKDGKFLSCDKDGGGMETVVERRCRYPYVLPGGMIYQDVEDHESLHLYYFDSGMGIKLTDTPSYLPTIFGDKLYFTTADGERYRINRMELASADRATETGKNLMGQTFLLDGHYIFAPNDICLPLNDWQKLFDNSDEGIFLQDFLVTPQYLVYFEWNGDGELQYRWLMNEATFGGSHF